jgi:hypothetical protein
MHLCLAQLTQLMGQQMTDKRVVINDKNSHHQLLQAG